MLRLLKNVQMQGTRNWGPAPRARGVRVFCGQISKREAYREARRRWAFFSSLVGYKRRKAHCGRLTVIARWFGLCAFRLLPWAAGMFDCSRT
jgi:hypothetical protein